MIRRDYILRMIEEFTQTLARLKSLKKDLRWDDAERLLEKEFQEFIGTLGPGVTEMSETELLARLVKGAPTQAVRERTLMLATLLREAGDVAVAQGAAEQGRRYYLKGLELVLDVGRGDEAFEWPAFVPAVDLLVMSLGDEGIPIPTRARLMQHFELSGDYAKAEDALFAMLEQDPLNPSLLDFGAAFYRRLLDRDDAALANGNLPREEVEAGLAELRAKQADLVKARC
jgi:hypothetical protein